MDNDAQLLSLVESVTEELQVVDKQIRDLRARRSLLNEQLDSLKKRREKSVKPVVPVSANDDDDDVLSVDTNSLEWWENKSFPAWDSRVQACLRGVFQLGSFRMSQRAAINAVLARKDCILIMPTGAGKSLCYQLPACLLNGITVVISPLVSLMEDQQLSSTSFGIASNVLNSQTKVPMQTQIMKEMRETNSELKIVYITPEKFAKSDRLKNTLHDMYGTNRLTQFVIDEIHCASQWGHSFRQDYLNLCMLKELYPTVPILGLTATGTSRVVDDIKQILSMNSCLVFRSSFNRLNLFYEVLAKPKTDAALIESMVALINHSYKGQSGIVYCATINDCEEVSKELLRNGIKCAAYHSAVDGVARSDIHHSWLANRLQVIVATIAFGLGIDKPDVRFILHHQVGKSIEHYYQESGRAGRDGRPARCIMYFRPTDTFRISKMVVSEKSGLSHLYSLVRYCLNPQYECRRKVLAQHFGEPYRSEMCQKMCDVCCAQSDNAVEVTRRNLLPVARLIVRTLRETDKRMTLNQLFDKLFGKTSTAAGRGNAGRVKLVEGFDGGPLTRDTAEQILMQLIIDGYVKEDFHFTAYNTISYLIPSVDAARLLDRPNFSICAVFWKPCKPGTGNAENAAQQLIREAASSTSAVDTADDKAMLVQTSTFVARNKQKAVKPSDKLQDKVAPQEPSSRRKRAKRAEPESDGAIIFLEEKIASKQIEIVSDFENFPKT